MKRLTWLLVLLLLFSCDTGSTEQKSPTELEKALTVLKEEGFKTDDYIVYDENHVIIEGDIMIDIKDLLNPETRGKHYRTRNLLSDNQVRNIRVRIASNVSNNWRAGVRAAMQQWNNVSGTKVNFVEVNSGEDVRVQMQSVQDGFLAFATFPQSSGRAGYNITVGSAYANSSVSYLTHVVVHEFGHTLGLRHTNYFDRNNDGNQSDNEGQADVGAIHIPGTPTSYSTNSIMNAFINQSTGSFTSADIVAIKYLYPDGNGNPGTISVSGPSTVSSGTYVTYKLNNNQSANWWYRPSGGSWQNIGNSVSVSGTVYQSFTLAAGYNGTYYYKNVTVN